ncbi:two-component sensor histidine kinase, partial [Bifidobacterium sp. MSK23_139]|nr:two-component sensor histidine kinase [Bifidobacterium sp. MSK23_139]
DDAISHIESSSWRMTVLVEDLLSLARLDEGRGVSMNQRVDFTSVMQDAVDDLHALDPDREITTMQLDSDL